MIDHTARAFDLELGELTHKIREMSDLTAKQIEGAIDALSKHDLAKAREVIAMGEQVDALQHDLEQEAIVTLARRQPMAVDLRDIVGALRISYDLERIGDSAENIAKRVLLIEDLSINEVTLTFRQMAQLALDQFSHVIQSYEHRDAAAALDVWRKNQQIGIINNSLFRELLTYMLGNPGTIAFCTHILFCAKNLERIGDHVTNIAETVHYIVAGHPLKAERPNPDISSLPPL